MVAALAAHGRGAEALGLFEEMVRRGVRPDRVAYVGALHACSHAGLVGEARALLERMRAAHGIEPGRSTTGPSERELRPRLRAVRGVGGGAPHARGHGLCGVGVRDAGNMYAAMGRWDESARARKMMRFCGVPKSPGWSSID
uniref:Pentatricopeptide repeat-containing protein n=1 Tax=Ananas comosus var. bracteatus TaxID=296719 RepID=A0A6V7NZ80_ANACO|nr:unnamed protein product [Ananas comosus var. bracteatus]